MGVESLRAVCQMVFESKQIYLECDTADDGIPFAHYDRYQRALVNIWLEDNQGVLENLTVKLASAGYMMSFYKKGINQPINAAMWEAIKHKAGMFNLPKDVFLHPFHLWDLRKGWTDLGSCPVDYKAFAQITNAPQHPESVWKEGQASVDEERELNKVVQLSNKTAHTEFNEHQWKEIENDILKECDGAYKVEKNQLVVIARREVKARNLAHEVFASYGSLREY
ncbi:Hypothetical predicted protein [Paramuricea clavata]|uniref:Uncharacterized protein n=1 Tax=Paramuricea clavata TaxID=317549 RepID=A0A6S7JLW9_PARCT|nr:Hypothetical predicted protein [Paramuricea clavata]